MQYIKIRWRPHCWLYLPLLAATLCCLISCCCTAQQYVFIGSYNWDKNKPGIYVYQLDTISGKLKHISTVYSILNPSFLTLSPDGRHVYACTETHTAGLGNVSSFAFDAQNGQLKFVNKQPSGGENPVYVTVHKSGKWLVNANYTDASVSVYSLSANGSIGARRQLIPFTDSSINKGRQATAHIHASVFSPAQDYVFFPDLGGDKIRCFAFDTAAALPLSAAPVPYTIATVGSGPRHLTFHPCGKFAYCIEELGGSISAYSYSNGVLTQIQHFLAHRHTTATVYSSADIHVSPDGRFLYASNRGTENNIAIFAINQENGQLSLVGYQSTLGDHPRMFAITPSGKYLVVANQISGDVIVFMRNIQTGKLQKTCKTSAPGASCVQIRTYE